MDFVWCSSLCFWFLFGISPFVLLCCAISLAEIEGEGWGVSMSFPAKPRWPYTWDVPRASPPPRSRGSLQKKRHRVIQWCTASCETDIAGWKFYPYSIGNNEFLYQKMEINLLHSSDFSFPLLTLPKTNSSPLKISYPKKKLVFQPSIFRCELLVSGYLVWPFILNQWTTATAEHLLHDPSRPPSARAFAHSRRGPPWLTGPQWRSNLHHLESKYM